MENSKLKEEMHKVLKNIADNADFDGHGKGSPAAKQFIGRFLNDNQM